jgi:hypothetical protein
MTTTQLKTEIQKKLERIPDDVLTELLNYLNELEKHSSEDIELAKFMKESLIEDRELLARLAQ